MASHTTVRFRNLPNNIKPQFFPGPPGGQPQRTRLLSMFVRGRTANHTTYSYQTTTVRRWEWEITLPYLTNEQKTTLEDLWSLHLLGASTEFIYRHTNGEEYTARIINDGPLEFVRTGPDMWDVDLILELKEQVDG